MKNLKTVFAIAVAAFLTCSSIASAAAPVDRHTATIAEVTYSLDASLDNDRPTDGPTQVPQLPQDEGLMSLGAETFGDIEMGCHWVCGKREFGRCLYNVRQCTG